MPETPFLVFFIVISLIVTFAVRQRIEVISRSAQFIFPIGLMILILVIIMNLSDINLDKLCPVLESSYPTLLKSIISPLDWISYGVAFGVIAAYSNKPKRLKMTGMIAIGTSGLILTVFSVVVVAVFGPMFLRNGNFPLLLLAFHGKSGNLEGAIVAVWFAWFFVRAALFAYVTCVSLCHLFELRDINSVILGEGVLATAYSYHQYSSFIEMSYYFSRAHFYYLTFNLFIPLGIWIVFLIRRRKICNMKKI